MVKKKKEEHYSWPMFRLKMNLIIIGKIKVVAMVNISFNRNSFFFFN